MTSGKHLVLLLLKYTLEASNIHSVEQLSRLAARYLSNDLGEKVMTLGERLRQEGRVEGRVEGQIQTRNDIAAKLLKEGVDLSFIVKITQLPRSAIKQIELDLARYASVE